MYLKSIETFTNIMLSIKLHYLVKSIRYRYSIPNNYGMP